jgi:ABC-type sugar transport systems, permease components
MQLIKQPERVSETPQHSTGKLFSYQQWMAYLFLAPTLLIFFVFTVLPSIMALVLSLTRYDILTPIKWIGLQNYQQLLGDGVFFISLRNMLLYVVMFVPAMVVLSLLIAIALNRPVPGMNFFRTLFYLPMITSSVAAATVWIWLLQRNYGLINQLLALVGINGPAWLADSDTALIAIVLVTLWQGLGGNIILNLAGLQGIPRMYYEAAELDGANPWQSFRYITWPSLRNTTFFITSVTLINSFQLFDQAYVMTQGGPAQSTLTSVYYIYQMGFQQLRMGYASAMAFVLFLIILVFSLINMRFNQEVSL